MFKKTTVLNALVTMLSGLDYGNTPFRLVFRLTWYVVYSRY